jgi:hypothetical protein
VTTAFLSAIPEPCPTIPITQATRVVIKFSPTGREAYQKQTSGCLLDAQINPVGYALGGSWTAAYIVLTEAKGSDPNCLSNLPFQMQPGYGSVVPIPP